MMRSTRRDDDHTTTTSFRCLLYHRVLPDTLPEKFETLLNTEGQYGNPTLVRFLYHWIYDDATAALITARIEVLSSLWRRADFFFADIKTRKEANQKCHQRRGTILYLSSTAPGALVFACPGDSHIVYRIHNRKVVLDHYDVPFCLYDLFPDVFVHGEEKEECSVCLHMVCRDQKGEKIPVMLTCSHVFHKGCIDQLEYYQNKQRSEENKKGQGMTCPNCRQTKVMRTQAVPSWRLRTYRSIPRNQDGKDQTTRRPTTEHSETGWTNGKTRTYYTAAPTSCCTLM